MNLALLIASLVATALTTVPGIPAGVGIALNAITSSLGVIIKSGVTTNVSTSVILATLTGVIAELKQQPGLPQNVLNDIQILDNALQAALAADQQAQVKVDPTALHAEKPIA